MSVLCQIVGMDSLKRVMTSVSPDITICVRGRHAVGKSEAVYQAASEIRSDFYKDPTNCAKMMSALSGEVRTVIRGRKVWVNEWKYEYGIPVVERRLSQMTEGDIIGLPEMATITDGRHEWRSTSFRPCDWLIQSCQFPVMLFLDERNRALQGVKQAVFQLADSKVFYGEKLHNETRIVVAENIGENYQVEQSDPAEVSRWVTFELEPSDEEWLRWAEDKCHQATIEFIRANPKALEHRGTYEPDKKYPDRRAWFKLDQECQRLGLFDTDDKDLVGKAGLLYHLAGGFVGPEWGSKFNKFVQERDREIKATDILASWKKAKEKLSKGQNGVISNEQYIEAVAKLADWLKVEKNVFDKKQAKNYAAFMHDCPPEPCLSAWAALQKNTKNLFAVRPYIEKLMVARASGQSIDGLVPPDPDSDDDDNDDSSSSPGGVPQPRKRGRRR